VLDISWRLPHANLFVDSSSDKDVSSDDTFQDVQDEETLFEDSGDDVSVEEPLPAGIEHAPKIVMSAFCPGAGADGLFKVHPDQSDDCSASVWADSLHGSSADCAMSLTMVAHSSADADVDFMWTHSSSFSAVRGL
jgi:hypothetical protein